MSPAGSPTILTIDIGTSALKAVVYDEHGRGIAMTSRRYQYRTPRPGWAEMAAGDWWDALVQAMADLAETIALSEVQALALTGQMHAPVLLDEHGVVLDPTILWLDRRAEVEAAELQQHFRLPPYQINATYTLPNCCGCTDIDPRYWRAPVTYSGPKTTCAIV